MEEELRKQAEEMNIEQLLVWQICAKAFVEIYTNGSCNVSLGDDFDIQIDGDTLLEGLRNAYVIHRSGKIHSINS